MTDTLKTISPVDGRIYVERPLADAAGIDRALIAARAAQPRWGSRPLGDRCELLARAVDAFVARGPDIAAEITWQMGRTRRDPRLQGARALHAEGGAGSAGGGQT
jgi:acyl-CoA reductase-like NAD-dependent aldehyde dehydrogenase